MKLSFGECILKAILIAALLSPSNLSAIRMPDYSFRIWQTDDGLPHNFVSAILQTRDGQLWVAARQQLARFDGIRFRPFDFQHHPALQGKTIRCLLQTRDGTLWIGTDKGLISFLAGEFTGSSFVPEIPVRALLETGDGALWIGTASGLARYTDGHCTWFTIGDGMIDDSVLALCEDQDANLWVGTSRGLSRFRDGFAESYIHYEGFGLTAESVRVLFCDYENSIWIGTGGEGLMRLKNGELNDFKKTEGIPDLFVSTIFEDSEKQLWVGTMSGLCRRVGEKFVTELTNEGASYGTIFCLTEDVEGHMWIGANEGLIQLREKPFKTYARQNGLSHNNAMSVCEDGTGGIWVTTWGGGASRLKDGKITLYNRENSPLFDLLLSVKETRDGSLWFGTDYDGGLFRFRNGVFTRYQKDAGIIDPAVRVVFEDRHDGLWLGTSGALYLMRNGKVQRFTTGDGLAGNIIRAIYEDHEGNLWIGSNDGLSRMSSEEVKLQNTRMGSGGWSKKNSLQPFTSYTISDGLPANQVLAIHQDLDGTIWVGTDGGGLCRISGIEALKPKFSAFSTKDGLFSDRILEVLEDDRGYLWMSCFSGIFRVKKQDLDDFDHGAVQTIPCTSYGKADGMSSVQCNGVSKPAGWKARDGRLWFPTTRGVVVVDPNSIRENDAPPPVVIEEVIADKKVQISNFKVQSQNNRASASTRNFEPETLNLPPGRGELEFHYTALSFRTPEKNRFRYKLEGVDSDWVDAGTRRVAYYNNINPGSYTFRVVGCNQDGVWSEEGTSLSFVLLPQFWQTGWFIGLNVLFATGMVAGAARHLTRKRMQRRLLRLEQQHALERERTRIAQDMHDDLGARLTEIILLSDRVQKSGTREESARTGVTISEVAREVASGMNAIVWAVNPKNDSLDKMVSYLCNYAVKFLGRSSIECLLEAPDECPPFPVSSETRHDVFLVLKEALNNVVKHAGATEVKLRLQLLDSTLQITIEDNGKGFEARHSPGLGNGLFNMAKRMEKISGAFNLQSTPGRGTRIEMKISLRMREPKKNR